MAKKIKISPEDLELFLNAVKGSKRLQKKERILPPSPSKQTILAKKPRFDEDFTLSEKQILPSVASNELIAYKKPSVSNIILRKLRKGQYNVEAILDLHGMSVEDAGAAMIQFLQTCMQKQVRVALIIHGKAHATQTPILKNKLNHWLREIDVVLAFCSATKAHGREGAMYVLLTSRQKENSFG